MQKASIGKILLALVISCVYIYLFGIVFHNNAPFHVLCTILRTFQFHHFMVLYF